MGRKSLRKIAEERVSDIAEKRTNAIELMNGPLRSKFNRIEKSVNDLRAESLRYYHKIGKLCEEIKENPDRFKGTDGTPGLKLVEQALSTQARTLRSMALFARKVDDAELEELIEWEHPETQFRLHWGHVSFLLSLDDQEERTKFAEEAVNDMLDPNALHARIKKVKKRSSGHGRPHAMPATNLAKIRQLLSVAKGYMGKHSTVWNSSTQSIYGDLMSMETEDITVEMIELLEEARDYHEEIVAASEENVDQCNRTLEHMRARLEEYNAEVDTVAEEAEVVQEEPAPKPKRRQREQRAIDLANNARGRRAAASV